MKSHALETDRSGRTEQTVLVETDRYLEKIDLASNVAIDISKVDGFSVLEITRISQVFESCPGLRYRDRYLLTRCVTDYHSSCKVMVVASHSLQIQGSVCHCPVN